MERNLKDRSGLKAAMEMSGIPEDASMSFHNARNDAWYTALVFKTLSDPDAVLNYPQKPRPLLHSRRASRERVAGEAFDSVRDALASEAAVHPACPRCGRVLALDGEYIRQSVDRYIAVAKCSRHGKLLIRLRFRVDDDGKKLMSLTTASASAENVAYVHTKQYQARMRQERFLAEHGVLPDPDEELLSAGIANMPFD